MKVCKLLHINDGSAKTLMNRDFHFLEEYTWAAETLNQYLADGYEVRHMIPVVMPAPLHVDGYGFYSSGFTVYLEKDVPDQATPSEKPDVLEDDELAALDDDDLGDLLGLLDDDDLIAELDDGPFAGLLGLYGTEEPEKDDDTF